MLSFYRTKNCPRCEKIQEILRNLVIAHRVMFVQKEDEILETLPEPFKLPVLIDDDAVIQGSDEILKHLERLEEFKSLWDQYQSDACYCNEEENLE